MTAQEVNNIKETIDQLLNEYDKAVLAKDNELVINISMLIDEQLGLLGGDTYQVSSETFH